MTTNLDRTLPQLLDECAELLIRGESVNGCLARYPEQAASLAPLLQPLAALRQFGSVPPRDVAVAARSRAQFMTAVSQLPAAGARRPITGPAAWWARFTESFQVLRPLPAGLMAAVACILVIGLLATGVVSASASALPGDRLYGVKLVAEQARLALTLDPAARQIFGEQMQQTRLHEAGEVVRQHREVTEMSLDGKLEDVKPGSWQVAGLTILLDKQTTIVGTPVVGSAVHGTVRAPGDGTLVGILLRIDRAASVPAPVPSPASVSGVASEATPFPTPSPLVVTNTPPPTLTPPKPPASQEMPAPLDRYPTRTRAVARAFTPVVIWATATPTPFPVLGTAPVPTPATTVAPATAAPRPTDTPWPTPPRINPKVVIDGYVEAAGSDRWTVSGTTVEIDSSTVFVDNPRTGDLVRVTAVRRSDGSFLAQEIKLMARAATPEPIEFTGPLLAKGPQTWVIYGRPVHTVKISADTVIAGDPQVGDPVKCTCSRNADGIHARRIEKIPVNVYDLAGIIEELALDHWRISSYNIYIVEGQTVIGGPAPQVGRLAQARVAEMPNGQLMAQAILVLADTPTPVPTWTPRPTNTPTPADTPLPTSTPTPSATPQPTSTDTVTPTNTPVPSLGTNVPPDIISGPTETPAPAITTAAGSVPAGR